MFFRTQGADGTWHPRVDWDGEADQAMADAGKPFVTLEKVDTWTDDESGRTYSSHVWGCNALDPATGRCTIYERRPDVCREFEPASDRLCVHYGGAETGETDRWPL